jgi:WD40 repeat protein
MTSSSVVGDLFVVGDELGRTFLYHRTKQDPFTQAITFHQHRGPINAISFAPLSLAFACASSDGTASVTVCDTSTWQIFPVQVSNAPITSVSWSPPRCFSFIDAPNTSHEVRFVVGTADGYMSLFQKKGNAVVADQPPIEAHRGAVNCVAWRPLAGFTRDEIATCGTDGMVTLWTFEPDGRIENGAIFQCDEEPVDLKWSACGFIISVSSGLTTVSLWRESEHGIWIKIEPQE